MNKNSTYMIKCILSLIFLINTCSLKAQDDNNLLFRVDFQDFFKNDKVSFRVNKQDIFTNQKLKSDLVIGRTEFIIKIFNTDNCAIALFKDKIIHLKKIVSPIILEISINNHLNTYVVNLDNGKYLGFSKKKKNELDSMQLKRSYMYE
ncbi:MAG: hypothetical protein Q8862_00720 [Bacteroidota bacterium]|nr:hypothetical protein [Bacteroidota bacterium]MDP4206498.1 hypothetical protein [Bacteroidota bacterium]